MNRKKKGKNSDHKGTRSNSVRLPLRKKLLFALITVAILLVGLELILALFGVRPALYEKDPYVGFTQIPLFEEKEEDGEVLCATARNKLKLFNPQSFPRDKPEGTYRIFSLGGSTTHGRPYDDATSFSGWLRAYLEATASGRDWEVINAGGVSYASYRVALLMEQLIAYEPDLFIIYSGHNEFLEERTYGEIKDTPSSLLWMSSWAARSRAATLGAHAIRSLSSFWTDPPPKNELASEVDTGMIGLSAYERDDVLQEKVLKHYRYNLLRMVDIARSVGARVVLVTPASNLLGASPFKSQHREGLTAEQLTRWNELDEQAGKLLEQEDFPGALEVLTKALQIDDRHALSHFRRGRALVGLGRYEEAKEALVRAMDEDVCPLRALSPTARIVAEVAADRGVPLVDFVALQEKLSEHGIPGNEVFLDHVHPTIESHRLLALEILRVMAAEGIVDPSIDDATLVRVKNEVNGRIDRGAHGQALMNLSKVLGWAGKVEEAHRLAIKAVELSPESAAVRYQAGLTAQLLGKIDESIDHYTKVIEIDPTAALAYGNLGVSLDARGYLASAVHHYELALEHGEAKDAERNQRNLTRAREKLRQ
jgi:tetratricopeptide (TPR) repeat protein